MIEKPLEEIDVGTLESLVFNRIPEGRALEFKRDLPGGSDGDIKEFLDDVTSLANAQGGDLIFGIAEVDGLASDLAGVEFANRDSEGNRLENLLRDCVEPRLTAHFHWVPLSKGLGALIIRVPASLAFPHCRRFKGSRRFCSRNSAGKYEMDVHELRQAFTQSEQLPRRFRVLHNDALRNARGEEMPFSLNPGPAVVATLAPLGLFRDHRDLPITPENALVPPRPSSGISYPGGIDCRKTLEGVLISARASDQGTVFSYALTHRTGRIDAAWTIGGPWETHQGEKRLIWPENFEQGLVDFAKSTDARFRPFGLTGPWVLLVTIVEIRGFQLVTGPHSATAPAWRDGAMVADAVIDNFSADTFDAIFRSFWLLFGEDRPPK